MDEKYGYLTPVGDPHALAEGILKALARPIPKELLLEAVKPFAERAVVARHFGILGLRGHLPPDYVEAPRP